MSAGWGTAAAWGVGLAVGAVVVGKAMGGKPKRKRKKKTTTDPPVVEPWENETLVDLSELAGYAPDADPPVHLEPGGRFWLRIDEGKLGTRAAVPQIGSVGDDGRPRPPCLVLGEEHRRGKSRYVQISAAAASAYCTVWVEYDTLPASAAAKDAVGFRVRVDPPLVTEVGRDNRERGGHLVLRPGERKLLDCGGHVLGHVTVVLPAGDYMSRATSRNGGLAMLVELSERPEKGETVATWLITEGGDLLFEHERTDTCERYVCGVKATSPRCRYGRL